jgi:hypothetical protein
VQPYTGRPLTVQQMLEVWRANRMDLMGADEAPLTDRPLVAGIDDSGEQEITHCGDRTGQSTGCGFAEFRGPWAAILAPYGYTTDDAGLVRLLGMESLYQPPPLPDRFVAMHDRFRNAVLRNDDGIHVADLPLPPQITENAEMRGAPEVGQSLNVDPGRWIARPGAWTERGMVTDFDVAWARCAGTRCEPLPGRGLAREVTEADEGHHVTATIRAENEHGTSAFTVRSGDIPPASAPPGNATPAVAPPAEREEAAARVWLVGKTLRVRGGRAAVSLQLVRGAATTVRVRLLRRPTGRLATLRSRKLDATANRRVAVSLELRRDARRLRAAVVELRWTTAGGRRHVQRRGVKLAR